MKELILERLHQIIEDKGKQVGNKIRITVVLNLRQDKQAFVNILSPYATYPTGKTLKEEATWCNIYSYSIDENISDGGIWFRHGITRPSDIKVYYSSSNFGGVYWTIGDFLKDLGYEYQNPIHIINNKEKKGNKQ